VDEHLRGLADELTAIGIATEIADTEHFLTTRTDLATLFAGKKTYLMETFYRSMRRKYKVLMDADNPTEPLTGQWNYDADNRKKLPDAASKAVIVPKPFAPTRTAAETTELAACEAMVRSAGVRTIGNFSPESFFWTTTREQALALLEFFASECLPNFGTYEDAMHTKHWSVFHARLSYAMNVKLLSPIEVVERCVAEWERSQTSKNSISIAQIEGFVRQIIGWREYMRGVYWAQMPSFAERNYFEHSAPLPDWYWTGETKMNCLHHAIGQSLEHAYAHHIQRLMVTGGFALLAGVSPDALDEWYLGIYADAIEWVEITNTRGMSQFADGGIVGTKPYAGSANYMDKMSNYCASCHYDKSKRHEADSAKRPACPFNSLYWDFYHRHHDKLAHNPRIGMAYRTLERMDPDEVQRTLAQAAAYKQAVNEL
jgi:deoxyribodipyrimidine photolyase-related protein